MDRKFIPEDAPARILGRLARFITVARCKEGGYLYPLVPTAEEFELAMRPYAELFELRARMKQAKQDGASQFAIESLRREIFLSEQLILSAEFSARISLIRPDL